MPIVVAIHRLKNFDEWFKLFKSNPPPKVGRWPVAFAQATDRMRRIGVLMPLAMDDPEAKARLAANVFVLPNFRYLRRTGRLG